MFRMPGEPRRISRLTFGIRYNLELGSIEQNDHYVNLDTTSPSPLTSARV